jgi:ferredoxin--NADP+ reductase
MMPDDKFYRARVTTREEFAPDLWMIRIQPGGEFKFAPGQYATLGVEHDGRRTERPYSIVSAPFENEIEFFFELVPEGALTPRLYKLQPGDELLMRKIPKGKFTLDTESERKHHLLDATNTTAYLCGHPDMIANSKAILKRRGFVDRTAIKEEIYWIPAK